MGEVCCPPEGRQARARCFTSAMAPSRSVLTSGTAGSVLHSGRCHHSRDNGDLVSRQRRQRPASRGDGPACRTDRAGRAGGHDHSRRVDCVAKRVPGGVRGGTTVPARRLRLRLHHEDSPGTRTAVRLARRRTQCAGSREQRRSAAAGPRLTGPIQASPHPASPHPADPSPACARSPR